MLLFACCGCCGCRVVGDGVGAAVDVVVVGVVIDSRRAHIVFGSFGSFLGGGWGGT